MISRPVAPNGPVEADAKRSPRFMISRPLAPNGPGEADAKLSIPPELST